ncbi:MAG: glutamate racemase [Deltaproteobacteria bacterium]|nr:glutamate racemase [Deltaproteobacteria bacterium]
MTAIGVFDSGVGGLTVVRALKAALPRVDIVYLGDTARVPYGSKSPRTVERYALACSRFLLDRQVAQVMIACNTASATALDAVREASPVPVTGAVQPGASAALAATESGHVAVIGTLATINSGAYEHAILAQQPSAVVTTLACPLLVPLAEEGWTDGEIADLVALRYLAPLFESDPAIDTLVLGCTHYPLLRTTIESVALALTDHPVAVVDSATSMAAVASSHPMPEGTGKLECFVTDATRATDLAPRFLGHPQAFELVDL